MKELEISRAQLNDLSTRLDEFAETLTEQQRTVLLAVMALAAQTVEDRTDDSSSPRKPLAPTWVPGEMPGTVRVRIPDEPTLPKPSTAFRSTFYPGDPARFDASGEEGLERSVAVPIQCVEKF